MILIKDVLTDEFYCVTQTDTYYYTGKKRAGVFDFPYWSADKNNACNFCSKMLAKHEMNMNDLTVDGTRSPVVVEENLTKYAITWHNGKEDRYMDFENSKEGTSLEKNAKLFETKEEAQLVIDEHKYFNCGIVALELAD